MNTRRHPKARLQVQLDNELKQAAIKAAEIANCDLTTLVTRALHREIELAHKEHGTLWLDTERYARFVALLDSERTMSDRMKSVAINMQQEGYYRSTGKTQ